MSPVPMARVSDAFTLTDAPGVNTKPALWQAEVRPMILSFVVASVAGGIVAARDVRRE